jgi:hypothetical protein
MSQTRFEFELTADDYVKTLSRGYATRPVVEGFLKWSLVPAMLFWIIAREGTGATPSYSFLASLAAASIYFLYHVFTWRKKYESTLFQYYSSSPQSVVLGPHQIEFTDEGMTSTGPMHKTFRRWEAVTYVAEQADHFWIYTAFGVNYVLPKNAIGKNDELIAYFKDVRRISVGGWQRA